MPQIPSTDGSRHLIPKALVAVGGIVTAVKTLPPTRVALLMAVLVGLAAVALVLVMVWQVFLVFREVGLPKVCRALGDRLATWIRLLGVDGKGTDPPKVDEPADTG